MILDTWKVDGEDIDDEIQTSKFEDILFEHDCYPLDKVTADAIQDVKEQTNGN